MYRRQKSEFVILKVELEYQSIQWELISCKTTLAFLTNSS